MPSVFYSCWKIELILFNKWSLPASYTSAIGRKLMRELTITQAKIIRNLLLFHDQFLVESASSIIYFYLTPFGCINPLRSVTIPPPLAPFCLYLAPHKTYHSTFSGICSYIIFMRVTVGICKLSCLCFLIKQQT